MRQDFARKKLKRFEVAGQGRFVTCSCWQRLPLLGNARIRDAFARQIALARKGAVFQLLGWVVMPEHFHLLIIQNLLEWTMPKVLRAIKTPFAKHAIARWRELKAPVLHRLRDWGGKCRFWQRGGGYDRNIYSDSERLEKLNYIHNNPTERRLVANPLDWRWSSARAYAGCDDVLIPIDRVA